MNTNTKYWSFTWDTNVLQKKIPTEKELLKFLNTETDYAVFQFELGSKKKKEHIQGSLTLSGPRISKSQLLLRFTSRFKNTAGLTLNPVCDKVAMEAYVTKEEGRVKGPFYGGKKEMFDEDSSKEELKNWQLELYSLITGPTSDQLKNRKVVWVQDGMGSTGKSWFQKWLRIGQKKLNCRALPVSNVDRLMSAISILTKEIKVDLFTVDLTRSKGKDMNFEDLYCAIEQIKNGYVVDVMYGRYNEAIFEPPMIIIFTNLQFEDHRHYLSADRWIPFCNQDDQLNHIVVEGNLPHYIPVQKERMKNNKK